MKYPKKSLNGTRAYRDFLVRIFDWSQPCWQDYFYHMGCDIDRMIVEELFRDGR